MLWELKDKGVIRPKDLPDHIERRLRFALAKFDSRIQKVIVFLHDQNGPRGGIDKVCRILVKTRGCGAVIAAVMAARADGFAGEEDMIVVTAGVPFNVKGTTNILRVAPCDARLISRVDPE